MRIQTLWIKMTTMPNTVSSMQLDATIFASSTSCDSACSKSRAVFSTFWSFLTFRYSFPLSPFLYLIFIGHRSPWGTPHPMHRSTYSQVPFVIIVAYIAVAQSWLLEKNSWQSWNSAPAQSSTPCHHHGLWSFLLVNGMGMEYAQCNGSRMSDKGIAFLSFLWGNCHGPVACLVVDAKT